MTIIALIGGELMYLRGLNWRVLVFDPKDMDVYFRSASWIIEGGRLYREVPSEYPLFANIIFASVRFLGDMLHPGRHVFYCLWIALTGVVYLYAVYRVATGTSMLAALAWLAPASIFFALYRFDIYPAIATLMALFAIQRASYIAGAIWLGAAIALKGYALFLLPAYCVFMIHQRGFATAIKIGVLAFAPMIVSLFATFIFAGWDGVLAPFAFHAERVLNGTSTYDAINYLFGFPAISGEVLRIAPFLQIACALAAAAMRPRTFDDLVNSFLFVVLGFISFFVFNSPQFVLWILPIICFSQSRIMLILTIVLCWLTYFYFPIRFHRFFRAMIIAVSSIRLFMMSLIVNRWRAIIVLR
jgi:hypothetical protein